MQNSLLKTLAQGTSQLNVELQTEQFEKLIELQQQLVKWNKTYNLTAITDEQEMLKLHLLDSLAVVPYWNFQLTLDVGTGAGFPGLPLAIALPSQQFHLLDSNSKKIRFIRQQIHHLDLKNVTAYHSRVESHSVSGYNCIVSRAFASITDMVMMTKSLLAQNGCWMAMKGAYSQSEIDQLPDWVEETERHQLQIPELDANRCVIKLVQRND